jgi:hypothetical protein
VPVGDYFAGAVVPRFLFFKMRQVERDMDRLIKIRIRLLVILRQIVQFLQQRFAFAFEAIVDPRQTNRIIFLFSFSR